MAKRAGKAKKRAAPKKDSAWFQRKVAELKNEVEKLPADRKEEFTRKFKAESEQ